MIAYFVLGIALLVGLILLVRWFVNADPKDIAKGLRWTGLVIAVIFGVWLVLTGRWLLLPLAIFALLPLLRQMRAFSRMAKSAHGPTPGKSSEIETAFLRMALDHDTGEMGGEILQGRFAGRELRSMGLHELLDLLVECHAHDAQSATVLETFLDRAHPDWRDTAGAEAGTGGNGSSAGSRPGTAMTRGEALAILGLEEGAGPEDIKEAHRHLMMKLHPDQGGSTYLATKINQAKETLLKG